MKLIFVDSRDRVSGTPCDFTIQLPETIALEGKHTARVDAFRLPIAVPTIQTGVNDTLSIQVGATTYTVTLPQQNFDGPTLASTLQSLLVASVPGTWTVTYDVNNIALTISCSNNFTLVGGTYGQQLLARANVQTAKSFKSLYCPVQGIDVVYLCSPNFTNLNTIGPNGSHDTLMSITVTMPYGSVQDNEMPQTVWFDVPGNTCTQQLSFQLRDRNYNLLNIVPNISFLLTID